MGYLDDEWGDEGSDGFFTGDYIESDNSSLEDDGYLNYLVEQAKNQLAEDPDNEDLRDDLHRLERQL